MADDRSNGANPSTREREASERAGGKHLGEDGRPQTPPTAKEQGEANCTRTTVTTEPDPNPHEIGRTMGKR